MPKDDTGKSKYFEGLPIPSSLFICAGMAVCVYQGRFDGPQGQGNGLPWGLVGPLKEHVGVEVHWFAVLFAGWAAAMVSKTLRCVLSPARPSSAGPASADPADGPSRRLDR